MKPIFITGGIFLLYLLIVAKGSVSLRRNPVIRIGGVLSFFFTLFFLINSIVAKLVIVGVVIGFFYLYTKKNKNNVNVNNENDL